MKKFVLFCVFCLISLIGIGQKHSYFYSDSLLFLSLQGDTILEPFTGGFNNSQFSAIDLNHDNILDLMVFDGKSKRIKTFINKGGYGKINYQYSPEYEQYFPKFTTWVLARDYNCDGKMDLFYGDVGDVGLYTNISTSTELKFELYTNIILCSAPNNKLYSGQTDIPAIDDIDGDGDLDFASFSSSNTPNLYVNRRVEDNLPCDTLVFRFADDCWGSFTEASITNSIYLSNCSQKRYYKKALHTGSSLLTLDMDEDGDKDLILGDPGFPDLKIIENGKTDFSYPYDTMIGSNSPYPTDVPVNIYAFPAAYYLDINNDGVKDLLVSNLDQEFSSDLHQNWIYLNRNKTNNPDFEFIDSSFLQSSTIDFGSISKPFFFDVDGDGDEDLLVSSNGNYTHTQGKSDRVAVYERKGSTYTSYFQFKESDWQNLSSLNIQDLHLCFGDLNGDGLQDLLLGKSNGYLSYLQNTGSLSSPSFNLESDSFFFVDGDKKSAPFLYDMDGDTDLDLLLGDNHGKIKYFENTGTKLIPTFSSIETISSLGKISVNDTFYKFDINGNPIIDYKPEGYSTPVIADLDMDGSPELVVGCYAGYVHVYEINPLALADSFKEITNYFVLQSNNIRGIAASGQQSVAACNDINGDSLLDFVIGNVSGGLQYLSSIAGQQDSAIINSLAPLETIDFLIYPNPSKDIVTLRFSEASQTVLNLEIIDLSGKVLKQKSINIKYQNKHFLDLSAIASGVYLVNVHSPNHKPITKRLVILK